MTSFLPVGYQQVEYIQSDGNQYIDTGFYPNSDTRVTLMGKTKSTANNGALFYGASNTGSGANAFESYPWFLDGYSRMIINYNTGSDSGYITGGILTDNTVFILDQNKNVNSLTINGQTYFHSTSASSFSISRTLCLFALNRTSLIREYSGYILYSCKIYDNGTLVRNYIPARNSSNVYGLYDVVNNTWNPSASGSFSGGADIGVNLTPLPPTYQKCEYIQSTGTQYIDTGVTWVDGTSLTYELTQQYPSSGTQTGSGHHRCVMSMTNGYANVSGVVTSSSATDKHTYKLVWGSGSYSSTLSQTAYLDGSLVGSRSTEPYDTRPYFLFACCNWSDASGKPPFSYDTTKIYGAKFWRDSTLIRNLIPCFRKADGVVGMYDSVNDVFYQNAGSGTFSFEIDTEITFEKIVYQGTDLTQIKKGSEVVWKSENGVPYLTFSSPSSFTLATANSSKNWDGTLEYSTDTANWYVWDGTTTLSSVNNYLYLRGTGNTVITGKSTDYRIIITGTNVSCRGNIETLLDYQTIVNGQLPSMERYCFAYMFYNCTSLVYAPSLKSTRFVFCCYQYMFYGCSNLISLPQILNYTVPSNATKCCEGMFQNCTKIKLSITQTGEYRTPYVIPYYETYQTPFGDMFKNTGGTFTGTAGSLQTYYTSNPVV